MSTICWKRGRVLVWDTTCPDTLAPSYTAFASTGTVSEEAERKKSTKYGHLERSHFFVPIAVETFGVVGPEAHYFFCTCCSMVTIIIVMIMVIIIIIIIIHTPQNSGMQYIILCKSDMTSFGSTMAAIYVLYGNGDTAVNM